MKKSVYTAALSFVIFLGFLVSSASMAETKDAAMKKLQKTAAVFEQRLSQASNNEFYITNYGVSGHNVASGGAGWYWPRQSNIAYIFGQSIWFGVKRKVGNDTLKLVSVGYNPNSGVSWFVPGSIEDGKSVLEESDSKSEKYYMYMGLDFDPTGKNVKYNQKPVWPIRWKDQTKKPGQGGYFGNYVSDPDERKNYQPVFISGEDMFAIFKDSDIKKNPEYKPNSGYPIGIDFQMTVYSWGFGSYKDFVFFVYNVVNKSGDTLRDCYLAPAGDPDMGDAADDHNAFYENDPSLNLAVQWSEKDSKLPNNGVLGFDFLESPRVKTVEDSINVFNKTKQKRRVGEQIGLTTFRNWTIDIDPKSGPDRYDFMSAGVRDADFGKGDKRLLLATGPFTMLPNDTVRTVVCIMIAPGVGAFDPNVSVFTSKYLDSLVSLDKFAQTVYDNNFAAPKPPDPATITSVQGVDRGIIIRWDTLSEASVDTLSLGRDFYGYRVYRSKTPSGPWTLLMDRNLDQGPLPHEYIDVQKDSLTNNLEYYYWVASYDEGSKTENIPSLESPGVPNKNVIKAVPIGPPPGNDISFGTFLTDPSLLGSFKNVRVEVTNQFRFNQLFSDHPLQVSMSTKNSTTDDGVLPPGITYKVDLAVRDTVRSPSDTTVITYNPVFSAVEFAGNDTTLVGTYRSSDSYFLGCFKIAFDYSFVLSNRPVYYDTSLVTKGTANTAIIGTKKYITPTVNLGAAKFTVDFQPGGVDSLELSGTKYAVPYLNLKITNNTTGKEWTKDTTRATPAPYGYWSMDSYVWFSSSGTRTFSKFSRSDNKYYIQAAKGTDTVMVAHAIDFNGKTIAIDPYNFRGNALRNSWNAVPVATKDFSAGDQISTIFKGGVSGVNGTQPFPLPGAGLTTKSGSFGVQKYTKELLKQIKVVPNPFIVSHDGQISTDSPKLYFNHLPPQCSIRIYNVAGDLVKVIEHTNGTSQEIWDLLSDGRQRVASQLLIARIKTPDGTTEFVKFAVITGGYRSIR